MFLQGVEDFRRRRHPGLCNQHVLCGGLRDGAEQRAALRPLCSPLRGLSVLRRLPGESPLLRHSLLRHVLALGLGHRVIVCIKTKLQNVKTCVWMPG